MEVNGSKIIDISKFNYLLELTRGKHRSNIVGLPHTVAEYEEAKRILVITYGKGVKVHKTLVKELKGFIRFQALQAFIRFLVNLIFITN